MGGRKINEQKSNTVCSTVWQSRRVFRSAFNKVNGDFLFFAFSLTHPRTPHSPPPTPLHGRCFFTVKISSLHALFMSFSRALPSPCCLCSAHLLSPRLLYLLLLHIICFSMLTLCCFCLIILPSQPPDTCSCFELIQIKRRCLFFFFGGGVSGHISHSLCLVAELFITHTYAQTGVASKDRFNSFIRILQ